MDILQSGAFAALLAAIGAVLRPFFLVIRGGIEAIELLVGVNVATTSLRAALNDIEQWLNVTLSDQLRQGVLATIAELSAAAGFPLDANDPFSAESITNAVNARLNAQFEDVTDQASIERELKRIAAEKVTEAIGITIDDIESPEQWADAAGRMILDGVSGASTFIPREYACPPLNLILGEFCKTQICHECMDDYQDCLARRDRQSRYAGATNRNCTRSRRS